MHPEHPISRRPPAPMQLPLRALLFSSAHSRNIGKKDLKAASAYLEGDHGIGAGSDAERVIRHSRGIALSADVHCAVWSRVQLWFLALPCTQSISSQPHPIMPPIDVSLDITQRHSLMKSSSSSWHPVSRFLELDLQILIFKARH